MNLGRFTLLHCKRQILSQTVKYTHFPPTVKAVEGMEVISKFTSLRFASPF